MSQKLANIYFIGPEDRSIGVVKIGMTRASPESRLKTLQTGCPHKLCVYGYVKCSPKYEQLLHAVFSPIKKGGEWFHVKGRLQFLLYFLETMDQPFLVELRRREWGDDWFWRIFLDVMKAKVPPFLDPSLMHEWEMSANFAALIQHDQRLSAIFPNREVCNG